MVRNKLIEVPPFVFVDLFLYIYLPIQGEVAEWLGRGLQNLLQRFESALRLNKKARIQAGFFGFIHKPDQ